MASRAAFLEKVCGPNSDLHHKVEVLLESDAKAGSFIESPAIEAAARIVVRCHQVAYPPGAAHNGRHASLLSYSPASRINF
jgi:hypothetical protein